MKGLLSFELSMYWTVYFSLDSGGSFARASLKLDFCLDGGKKIVAVFDFVVRSKMSEMTISWVPVCKATKDSVGCLLPPTLFFGQVLVARRKAFYPTYLK